MAESNNVATNLAVSIGADTSQFQEGMEGLVSKVLSTIGEINPLFLGLTGTVVALGTAAVESFEIFENAENQIIAQTGATGETLEGLKDAFHQVYADVPGDANAAASAIAILNDRLGLQGDQLVDVTEQMAKLSALTGQTTDSIANATTQAFLNWGIATEDVNDKLNTLYSISQQNHLSVTQLAQDLADIGIKAQSTGLSFDQTAELIGHLSAQGINVTAMFQGFNKALAEASAAGVDISQVTLPGLISGIQNAGSASAATAMAIADFGTRAGPQLAVLINSGKLSIDSLTGSLNTNKTSIDDAYNATDNLGRSLSQLKDTLVGIFAAFGDTSFIKSLVNDLTTGAQAIQGAIYVMTGNQAGLDALNATVMKTTRVFQDQNQTLAQSNAIVSDGNTVFQGLGLTLNGVALITPVVKGAITDVGAAIAAGQLNIQLMTQGAKDLESAFSESASSMKTLFEPAIFDVASAQAQVNLAQQEAIQSNLNLQQAESVLANLINTHSKNNVALQTAEENLTLAKASAKASDDAYSESEKTLTLSKSANQAMTQALLAAQTALDNAIASQHLPVALSMAQADAAVSSALETQQETTVALQAAKDALSQFQNSTGFKDSATEQQLLLNVTGATQEEKAATDALKQSLTGSESAVSQSLQSLDRSIYSDTQTYTSYLKDTVVPANVDLDTSLSNLVTLKQNETVAANQLAEAILNENTVRSTEGSTTKVVTDAINAAKVAADNLKNSQSALAATTTQLTQNFGLTKDQIILLTASGTDAASQAQILQAAYNDLGVKSTASLTAMQQAADKAYEDIATSGTASAGQLLAAQIADLTSLQNTDTATGTAMTAQQQLTLAKLKQQQSDFSSDYITQWSTMYTSIDKDVQQTAASMINTLVTGQGSFGDEALKMLENIGDAVLTAFLKPATDAIAKFIAGSITDLLSGLKSIISSATDAGSALSNLPISGASNPGVGGIANSGAGAGESGASGASGAASAVSSSLTGIISAVGSVVSAIGSIGTMIESFVIAGKMASVELNTRQTATYLGATGGVIDYLDHILTVAVNEQMAGWFQPSFASLMTTVEHISSFATVNADSIGAIKDDSDQMVQGLEKLQNALNNVGTNITNSLAVLNQTEILGLGNVALDIQYAQPKFNVTNTVTISATSIANAVETVIQKAG